MALSTSPRIESKIICSPADAISICSYLKGRGFFVGYPSRYVYSLYFDTVGRRFLSENLSGQGNREKVRIRCYSHAIGHPPHSFLIERKIRKGLFGFKRFEKLTDSPFLLACLSSYKDIVLDSLDARCETYNTLALLCPQHFCRYRRVYLENDCGLRVTVDSSLGFSDDFGASLRDCYFNDRFSSSIVELKYDPAASSAVSRILSELPFVVSRCSKYVLGHSILNRISYL